VSEVQHLADGAGHPGIHPEHADYSSFADFADPDGTTWILQERGWVAL
jgi:hypothetical protein